MAEDAVAYEADTGQSQTDRIEMLAREAAQAAWDKKALGLKILSMKGLVSYTDYLIICSGTSDRQVVAIANSVQEHLRELGARPLGIEGRELGHWVLMDYGDLVIHVFTEAERDVYGLDGLWTDAPRLPIEAPPDLERPSYY